MSLKILCDLHDISFPQLFVSMSANCFHIKGLKAMEVLSAEQRRGPRKI